MRFILFSFVFTLLFPLAGCGNSEMSKPEMSELQKYVSEHPEETIDWESVAPKDADEK